MPKKPSGRFHTCSVCGKRFVWGPGWRYLDASPTPIKFCSEACEELFYEDGKLPYWPEVRT